MKTQETKSDFIKLRAEGKSYNYIAEHLHISKSTCSKWEADFKENIEQLKQENLEELYNSYSMAKEARIRKIGGTLERINEAVENIDLSKIPPERLLYLKLKYMEALKKEYAGKPYIISDHLEPEEIVQALADLLNRTRSGDITTEQTQKESIILSNLLKAYDIVDVKRKIDALESIIGGRT